MAMDGDRLKRRDRKEAKGESALVKDTDRWKERERGFPWDTL